MTKPTWFCTSTALLAVTLAVFLPARSLAQGQQQRQAAPMNQALEGYVSEDALEALYVRELDVGELGRNDARVGFFLNEDRDLIGTGDMLVDVTEPERLPRWSLQVGPRAYGALLSVENQDVFSIALGGKLSFYPSRNRRTAATVTLFYGPDILSFGNADHVTDIAFRLETQLTQSTRIFVGYRKFEFSLDFDLEVDDGGHVGVVYSF